MARGPERPLSRTDLEWIGHALALMIAETPAGAKDARRKRWQAILRRVNVAAERERRLQAMASAKGAKTRG